MNCFQKKEMKEKRVITLITDFGDKSGYAGVMKGVILTINQNCQIIDITHQISPQDIEEAAFLLHNTCSYFPKNGVHVVVVDPGVGSERKAILIETDNYWFVGPDNGVFSFVFSGKGLKKVWEITNKRYLLPEVSSTFHGRDIFAPIAAHISLGVPAEELGKEIKNFVRLKDIEPKVLKGMIKAKVIHIDRFGNLASNISQDLFNKVVADKTFSITVGGRKVQKLSLSYTESEDGEILALFGSSQWLEISLKDGNCQSALRVEKGAAIDVHIS